MNKKQIKEHLQYHTQKVTELSNEMSEIETALFAASDRASKVLLTTRRRDVEPRLNSHAKAVIHYERMLR